jgi:hypothetical protein
VPTDERYWQALQEIKNSLATNTTATTAAALAIVRIETELKFRPSWEPRMTALEARIEPLETLKDQGDGSWKTLVAVGGFIVGIGGLITVALSLHSP